jgi:UDP-glucose 4-epimerase
MKIKNKNILVTGGAGFIASHFVDLVCPDNKVRILDDFSNGEKENLKDALKSHNVQIVEGDIRNADTVKKSMRNIDVVFHFAAKGVRESINNPMPVHEVNALGALNLYMAAFEKKVERFIHISSSEIYGTAEYVPMDEKHPLNPETVYGASKLVGEFYGRAYNRTHQMPVTVIRPFNTYGPRSHFAGPYGEVIPRFVIRALNNKPLIIFGNGKQTRDFTYVKDTARGILQAAESDKLIGEIINIAYGKERSINEVAKIILAELGKKDLEVIREEGRPGDVLRLYADVTKAKKILKYEAKTSLEEGIKEYIQWLKEQDIDLKDALKQVANRNW